MTLVPLVGWSLITFQRHWHKVFDPAPNIGFLAHARSLATQLAAARPERISQLHKLIFADYLNAAITTFFVGLVAILVLDSVRLWIKLLAGNAAATTSETAFVPTRLAEGEI